MEQVLTLIAVSHHSYLQVAARSGRIAEYQFHGLTLQSGLGGERRQESAKSPSHVRQEI